MLRSFLPRFVLLFSASLASAQSLGVRDDAENAARLQDLCSSAPSLPQKPVSSPRGYIVDRGLHRTWEVVRNREHPEQPATAVVIQDTVTVTNPVSCVQLNQKPVVSSGMPVRLERADTHTRMELAAAALDPGFVGQRVRVKLLLSGVVLQGTVRGPGVVELGWFLQAKRSRP